MRFFSSVVLFSYFFEADNFIGKMPCYRLRLGPTGMVFRIVFYEGYFSINLESDCLFLPFSNESDGLFITVLVLPLFLPLNADLWLFVFRFLAMCTFYAASTLTSAASSFSYSFDSSQSDGLLSSFKLFYRAKWLPWLAIWKVLLLFTVPSLILLSFFVVCS